jgi:hypothetical protein
MADSDSNTVPDIQPLGLGGGATTSGTDGGGQQLDIQPIGPAPYVPNPVSVEDRMVPKPNILDTSFHQIPSHTSPGAQLWDDISGAPARIATEMQQTYQNADPVITPQAQGWARDNLGWVGRNLVSPYITGLNTVAKEGQAVTAGGLAAGSELLSGGNPALARDVHALLQTAPVAMANAPPLIPTLRPSPGPNYTGALDTSDVTPPGPSSIPSGPGSATLRSPVPVATPQDALAVVKPLYKSADESGIQIAPQFTSDWTKNLDQYKPQQPVGMAIGSRGGPVTDLITDLQKASDAPITNIQGIQEVDQKIQDAISAQYGQGNMAAVSRMRQIQQDFRQRYRNIDPATQLTSGDPQALQDFSNANAGYAAYSRMKDVQDIIDSTQHLSGAEKAQAIRSRVNAFLQDPANTSGWTPDEISGLASANQGGAVSDFIKAAVAKVAMPVAVHSLPLGLGAIGASTALDAAQGGMLAKYRTGQLNQAMRLLGQRVPQPGTAPPQTTPVAPPSLLRSTQALPWYGLLDRQPDISGQ